VPILGALITAFIVALLLSLLLIPVVGRRPDAEQGWSAAVFFFVLLFLFIWAGGVWVAPAQVGPPVFDVYWVPFLIIGIVVALLIAAIPWHYPQTTRLPDEEEVRAESAAATVFGIFFWVLALVLIAVIAAAYW